MALSSRLGLLLLSACLAVVVEGRDWCILYDDKAVLNLHWGYEIRMMGQSIFSNLAASKNGKHNSNRGWDDVISGAKADDGCRLHLYEHPFFRGQEVVIEGGTHIRNLDERRFNDKASSAWCECPARFEYKQYCDTVPGYRFIANADSPFNDIECLEIPEGTNKEAWLKARCDANGNCVAFNNDGCLKRRIESDPEDLVNVRHDAYRNTRTPVTECRGLYVKL